MEIRAQMPGPVRCSAVPGRAADEVQDRFVSDTLFAPRDQIVARSQHCLWATHVGGPICTPPAVGPEGNVYVTGAGQQVYALDGLSGNKLWSFDPKAAFGAHPRITAGADGTVYVGTEEARGGHIYALSAQADPQAGCDADGLPRPTLKWTFTADAGISQPPVEAGGILHAAGRDGRFYAIDAASGEKKWDFQVPRGGVHSFLAGQDGFVYVRSGTDTVNDPNNHLYALDARTGQKRFLPPWGERPDVQPPGRKVPTLPDGTTFRTRMDDNGIYAYDAKGECVWEHQTGGEVIAYPTIGPHGIAYAGSFDHKVYALVQDAATLVADLALQDARRRLQDAQGKLQPQDAVPTRPAGAVVQEDTRVVINGVAVDRRRTS